MSNHNLTITSSRQVSRLLACLIAVWLLSACSTLPTSKPVAPKVKILSVKPHKLGFSEQELAFQLQLDNPNTYDIALQSLTFIAKLDGQELAQGATNDPVTLPAQATAEMQVIVSTKIGRVLGQLLQIVGAAQNNVDYDIKGFVKLANWPVKIPFNVDGQLDNKLSN